MSYEGSSYVNSRESPGGPVVKSWIFTAIDLDSILGWGTKIPQTTVVQPKIKNLGFQLYWASLLPQLVENPPAMQETLVQFLGREDLLEKG